ncbi:MAG: 4-hydroxybutyryl-CoA dehydratase [Deltaproteobacteria bacterium]|nr:4-hydroxybutyryl-CoA dehydratase [Deltaproteobacteria bacterium]
MAIKTKEEYFESLKKQKPEAYMLGERVDQIVGNPQFDVQLNLTSLTYAAAHDPETKELARIKSSFIDEEVNLWAHIPQSPEDLIRRARLHRKLSAEKVCLLRCMFVDPASALLVSTYEMDKKLGTNYYKNVVNFVKRVQKEDLMVGGAVTDVRGDRSVGPMEQEDPDLYVHVVERRDDGIVVSGAKANITGAVACNELIVVPCRALRREEKDYAVAFVIPVDTKGIKYILRPTAAPREPREIDHPVSRKIGHIESMAIFENVFVPWDRVFMCGETAFSGLMVGTFASTHRCSKCACTAGHMDMFVGAAALMAQYNGVERAPHIREMLTEMIMNGEIGYHAAIASAVEGSYHPAGVWVPNFLAANVGKYMSCHTVGEQYVMLQDISGGIAVTAPTERDWKNPELRKYMEKFLRGKKGVKTENRLKAIKLIEDMTASEYAGWYIGLCINAAGSPQAERVEIERTYDLKKAIAIAKKWADIED